MPEYLAPGVYIEEVSYRSKSIEGVSTTTTGFVGPCRFGPIDLEPDVITSLTEFERVYGDRDRLRYGGADQPLTHNYLWHGARAFFQEGGKRLYIGRIFRRLDNKEYSGPDDADGTTTPAARSGAYDDGHARATQSGLTVRARFPGAWGNLRVRVTVRLGQNVLGGTPGTPRIGALLNNDIVWINDVNSPIGDPPGSGTLYRATSSFDSQTRQRVWAFKQSDTDIGLALNGMYPDPDPSRSDQVRVVTLALSVISSDGTLPYETWDGLYPDPSHQRSGAGDSLGDRFAQRLSSLAQERTLPVVVEFDTTIRTGLDFLNALFKINTNLTRALNDPKSTDLERSAEIVLTGGNDGLRPVASDYAGEERPNSSKTGLVAFEAIDVISIVAAPGCTADYVTHAADAEAALAALIQHAEEMRYRIAVLDSGDNLSISAVRAMRGRVDSTHAALYFPWVRVMDPVTLAEVYMPPSGFVAGIYARNDINRTVSKAPANEVVNLALGFELMLNKSQQDVLNPEGVNCFRFFEGRGFRLWGARTISSDPEWKYVNLRRYFAYLEHSVDRGTQWAVFEPNGPHLWDNVRRTIESFLFNEWQMGALLGDKPEKAFFVRCDLTTMNQNDLDNGRLVCQIGVAVVRPAEFVIFRIGQWTADRKA